VWLPCNAMVVTILGMEDTLGTFGAIGSAPGVDGSKKSDVRYTNVHPSETGGCQDERKDMNSGSELVSRVLESDDPWADVCACLWRDNDRK